MSKKSKKSGDKRASVESAEKRALLSEVIGSVNVNRWLKIKSGLGYDENEQFVKALLDLASKHLIRSKKNVTNKTEPDNDGDDGSKKHQEVEGPKVKKKRADNKNKKFKKQDATQEALPPEPEPEPEKRRFDEIVVNNNGSPDKPEKPKKPSLMVNISNKHFIPLQSKLKVHEIEPKKVEQVVETIEKTIEKTPKFNKINNVSKPTITTVTITHTVTNHDIRKAPELNEQEVLAKNETPNDILMVQSANEMTNENNKLQLCSFCQTRHSEDHCPLFHPAFIRPDGLSYEQFLSVCKGDQNSYSDFDAKPLFAQLSLPVGLRLDESSDTVHGLGVFVGDAKVEAFTRFGPLIGKQMRAVDIAEDCNMRDLYEITSSDKGSYISTEDLSESNWVRYIRPAPLRELSNLLLINSESLLYFVTIKRIGQGEELLYWQNNCFVNNKKKTEKTSCGGCNMTFHHPLYYRIHCSVFHDVRYSLTIRKYHCKVCGAAVLGKENIMKHATELHNGQGAYQCQFCKKFFLRLNYLEMHRTYGCSANPHRSRPLCDFCGRKFCQPQKLKVHIKRMHSDLADVLKEFQCKNCLKILGSRAALQRHFKEVHKKQVEVALKCNKCSKMFQNKSNLKIHMLTHSGIKPFRCDQKQCAAAFTTKQCLQFHYKKVHRFTKDEMPKIERSVDYTFEAYSGREENDMQNTAENSPSHSKNDAQSSDTEDSESDVENSEQEDPPDLHSPPPLRENDQVSNSASPPTLEAYAPNMKILSKGSKKWIGQCELYDLPQQKQINEEDESGKFEEEEEEEEEETKISASYETTTNIQNNPITSYRHESSNASLLVEAALDSVCSEPNIDIDVTTPNCPDSLVNNLYTLSQNDGLVGDVTYTHSVDVNDSRDINLISPSVNDQISVTDDGLRQTQNIGIDYSSFHQEDFTPNNSPRNNFRDYIDPNSPAPPGYEKVISPGGVSPPRYDFGNGNNLNPDSDDSNGIGVQNLSLHNGNDNKEDIQLDLSIYKSHYAFDSNNSMNFLRKDLRNKFSDEEHKAYEEEDTSKFSLNGNVDASHDNLDNELKDFESMDTEVKIMHKEDLDLSMRSNQLINLGDLRNKFEIDLDLRKSYDVDSDLRRNTYEMDDFRMKNYDIDNLDVLRNMERNKTYESLMDDFRSDRNFEPLIINPTELQGLDMSARGYHNYPNLNRYHPLYPPEVDRPSVDLRLNYSPPPPPAYPHADILRHSVDLSLRSQIASSRLLSEHSLQSSRLSLDQSSRLSLDQSSRLSLDQSRLLGSDLSTRGHIPSESRLISDMSNRILSDHTTNRILSNDQLTNRLLGNDQRMTAADESRLMAVGEQSRLLDQNRLLGPSNGSMSPVPYTGYSVSPSPYHPTALAPRPHTSPNATPYHHYSAYY